MAVASASASTSAPSDSFSLEQLIYILEKNEGEFMTLLVKSFDFYAETENIRHVSNPVYYAKGSLHLYIYLTIEFLHSDDKPVIKFVVFTNKDDLRTATIFKLITEPMVRFIHLLQCGSVEITTASLDDEATCIMSKTYLGLEKLYRKAASSRSPATGLDNLTLYTKISCASWLKRIIETSETHGKVVDEYFDDHYYPSDEDLMMSAVSTRFPHLRHYTSFSEPVHATVMIDMTTDCSSLHILNVPLFYIIYVDEDDLVTTPLQTIHHAARIPRKITMKNGVVSFEIGFHDITVSDYDGHTTYYESPLSYESSFALFFP